MGFRKPPADFDCPYQRACPHMDGLSARWAFSVFQEQWRQESQIRTLEADLEQVRVENSELRTDRDQITAQFKALHRKQFKAGKSRSPAPPPPERGKPKKRGPPVGHPPWRLDGFPAWLWYAGNADLDFFHIDRSRATEVMASILGDDYAGDIVSDGYAVYDALIARWRQTCLAPIIRTAKEIAAEIQLVENPAPYPTDIAFANAIAGFFSDVCALDQKRRSGRLSRKRARALVPILRRRLQTLCSAQLSHPKTLNLRDRLLSPERDAKKLFTFLTRPGMPPTNNHAERALRGPVLATQDLLWLALRGRRSRLRRPRQPPGYGPPTKPTRPPFPLRALHRRYRHRSSRSLRKFRLTPRAPKG